jgi:streptogramin lyase
MKHKLNFFAYPLSILILLGSSLPLSAVDIRITDMKGQPLDRAMVTVRNETMHLGSTTDDGFPPHGKEEFISHETSKFTRANGLASINLPNSEPFSIHVQKVGYDTISWQKLPSNQSVVLKMKPTTDPNKLISQYPSNRWVAALDWGEEKEHRKVYMEQCGFCHQQGSAPMRVNRSEEEWREIMNRMIGYGSRPSSASQKVLPRILSDSYKDLLAHPERVSPGPGWGPEVYPIQIREWPVGNSFSQMHDLLAHSNGKVYIGDNLQDRIWELDPKTGINKVHKVPRKDDDELGGLLSGRLSAFPKHATYVGVHSLAESPVDGHIFITPSLQKRIIELNPKTGEFTSYEFENGLYPHTIRIDKKDRVWYTLALSNQIGMFDRNTKTFKAYDIPPRTGKEKFSLFISGFILRLMNWGFPMHLLPVDDRVSGMPLPYGIDIAPDGKIWFARLHADTIGVIDPETGSLEVIETPFQGPRRLRADNDGNLWIAAFPEASIVRYTPSTKEFKTFPMPTAVDGVETPYSLNVDRKRNQVWATGTASDSLAVLDIKTEKWRVFPLPRKVSFTRDVEFSKDGKAYTCNGAFPSWHIEDGQPTLIEVSGY